MQPNADTLMGAKARTQVGRIAHKELALFFASPAAWLFLGSFAAVTLFVFFWGEAFFARNIADVRPLFEWMPILLIFLASALTMRSWSEERRTGTLEYVLTQPVPLWHFVAGKFQACIALLLLALLVTLPLPITVAQLGELDPGPVFAGYVATLLLGAAYISVGLFVSARSDNPIVSLIGSVVLCSLLYLLGSGLMTSFFGNFGSELLRALGSGARFESITRGVLDVRDLFYYLSLTGVFLCLNVYALERERWASTGSRRHHNAWRRATALLVVNLVAGNLWLSQVTSLRADMTAGRLFSISDATHGYLEQLREPLLLRGYFSAQTHPLLAPLVPQMRDLLEEYKIAGKGNVRVEIIDPAEDPEREDEANQKYGIQSVPFQVADRYQSTVVNSYFNVLVEYGDSHQVLGFDDLIEVKAGATSALDVQLRNPEFDLTRAIKQALYSYQASGNLFDGIDGDVELIGYVSDDKKLPEALRNYRKAIGQQLTEARRESRGRFSSRFLDPEAGDGSLAAQIEKDLGFKPMVASLFDSNRFYFYLTLSDGSQVVQLTTDFNNADNFRQVLDAGLKRFAQGFTKVVAFATPQLMDPQTEQFSASNMYRNLEAAMGENHTIRNEDLSDGSVDAEADILLVVAPDSLDDKGLFAIDQFLMRGGSLVLVTSPYATRASGNNMTLEKRISGLEEWLAHHGVEMKDALVLDPQNSAFPLPITRQVGAFRFQEITMVDYPFFPDLRPPALNPDHPITSGLQQITLTWTSPLTIDEEANSSREVIELLRSSEKAWTDASMDVVPRRTATGISGWQPSGKRSSHLLGTVISGRFDSWFAGKPSPLLPGEDDEESEEGGTEEAAPEEDQAEDGLTIGSVIERSPESARMVIYASSDFLTDQILGTMTSVTGSQYKGPLELMANTLDWALEDGGLLDIRSHSHFNRALKPLEKDEQLVWEYLNYALALVLLGAIALWQRFRRLYRQKHYLKTLGEQA